MALLDPKYSRSASVRARTAVSLLEIKRSDFDAMLRVQPSLAYDMARMLSQRLRDTDNATIRDLQEKNRQLAQAYEDLKAAQALIIEKEKLERELEVAREMQRASCHARFRSCLILISGRAWSRREPWAGTSSTLSRSMKNAWPLRWVMYPAKECRQQFLWL